MASRKSRTQLSDSTTTSTGSYFLVLCQTAREVAHKPLPNFVAFPKAALRVVMGVWAENVMGTKCIRMIVAVC